MQSMFCGTFFFKAHQLLNLLHCLYTIHEPIWDVGDNSVFPNHAMMKTVIVVILGLYWNTFRVCKTKTRWRTLKHSSTLHNATPVIPSGANHSPGWTETGEESETRPSTNSCSSNSGGSMWELLRRGKWQYEHETQTGCMHQQCQMNEPLDTICSKITSTEMWW